MQRLSVAMNETLAIRAAQLLAAIGAGLALLAAATGLLGLESPSTLLLAASLLVIGLAGFALAGRPVGGSRRAGEAAGEGRKGTRFGRNVRLAGYTLGMYLLFTLLGIAAVVGLVGSYAGLHENVQSLVGTHANAFFAAAALAIAGAIPLSAAILPTEDITPARQRAAVGAAGVVLAGVVGGLLAGAANAGAGDGALLLAVVGLFFVVRWNARLPDVAHILEWLETEEEVRHSRLPKAIVVGFSVLALLLAAGGVAATMGRFAPADPFIAVAGLAVVVASLGVGITPVASRFEYGREDLERARKSRVLALNYLAWGLAVEAAILVALLVVASLGGLGLGGPAIASLAAMLDSHRAALFAIILLPLVGTLLARLVWRSDRRYTEDLRAASALLASGGVLLLALAAFVGSGAIKGAFNAESVSTVLVGTSSLFLVFFIRTRTLLPRVVDAILAVLRPKHPKVKSDLKETAQRRMMWIYIGSAGLLFIAVGILALTTFTPVQVQASGTTRTTGLLVLGVLGLAVAGFVGYEYMKGVRREVVVKKEEDIGKRRLTPEELNRYILLGVAITLAAIFAIVGLLTFLGKITTLGPIALAPKYGTDFFVFAILVGLGPYAFYHDRELRRIQAIDAKFPEFLRDLSESQRSGMTLTEAVVTASKGTYGALTWEIRKMAAQVEWGVSFPEALQRFSKRVRTPLIDRTVSLVVQASSAGGNVVDILSAAADDSREIQLILKERKSAMSIYIMIIYIAFFVFMGVIAILNAEFIPQVAKAVQGAAGVTLGGLTFKPFDQNQFKMIFFHAAVIQGFGGGLVAGVMETGKPVTGLKHAFLMVAIAYVLFRFVIGG